ncbi:hypothetical protein SDC9_131215 [bioreactor metagenome]|uniref:Uncharacterized protein n=1 Tax=bioreactor metagenome TaxID=1076179 RepID=A0A645D492_9ZZZZ
MGRLGELTGGNIQTGHVQSPGRQRDGVATGAAAEIEQLHARLQLHFRDQKLGFKGGVGGETFFFVMGSVKIVELSPRTVLHDGSILVSEVPDKNKKITSGHFSVRSFCE